MQDNAGEIIFEMGAHYRNRLGWYRVLALHGDRMQVQYVESGKTDNLTIEIQRTIISNLRREERWPGMIDRDRDTFFCYVDKCNQSYRSGHDLGLYRELINTHRAGSGIDRLLDDAGFVPLIWDVLDAWNMNQRGAQLTTRQELAQSIEAHRPILRLLYGYRLSLITQQEVQAGMSQHMHDLFCGLSVMASKRRVVGVSKAMHFLLPDLVIPIDGTYTLPYFYGYNRYDSSDEAEYATFRHVFLEAHRITKHLNLTEADVDHQRWNTSVPKLIDDAIIGFFKTLEAMGTAPASQNGAGVRGNPSE